MERIQAALGAGGDDDKFRFWKLHPQADEIVPDSVDKSPCSSASGMGTLRATFLTPHYRLFQLKGFM